MTGRDLEDFTSFLAESLKAKGYTDAGMDLEINAYKYVETWTAYVYESEE